MLKLILRKKTFYLAILGIIAAIVLVIKSSEKPPPSQPLIPPNENPYQHGVAGAGIVEAVNENIRLVPAVSGQVKSLFVIAGDKVKKDQILLQLDDRSIKGQLLVARAELNKASSRLAKLKKLGNSEALSADERDTIRNDYQIAAAEVEHLELLLDQLTLRSTIDGKVLQVNTRPGEYIATPVGENYTPPIILGIDQGLQIRVDIDEFEAQKIRPGSNGVAYIRGSKDKKPIPLQFVRIEPYVIPKKSLTGDNTERVDTRVLQVIFRTDQTDNLYVGQQLDVYIEVDNHESANPVKSDSQK